MGETYSNSSDIGDISVPQGSKLAPLLYLMYVNDMPQYMGENCRLFQFADDTVLVVAEDTAAHSNHTLQKNYDTLCKWSHDNQLTINPNKTAYMIINDKQNVETFNITHHCHMCLHSGNTTAVCHCDIKLQKVDQFTYLGIEIDSKFNFKPHIEKVRKKLKRVSFNLYKMQYYTDKKTLKIIYHNLIESNVLYGLQIWGTASPSNLLPIKNQLEGILKMLVPKKLRNSNLYESLNVLSLDELFMYHFVLANYFTHKEEVGSCSQISLRPRNTLQLKTPDFNNKHGQRTQEFMIPSIFSKIPKQFLSATTYKSAKTMIKAWLTSKR